MEKLSWLSKKYLIWVVFGLFIITPLYPKFPIFNVPGTYVAIRLEDFLIALVILMWGITRLKTLHELFNQTIFQAFVLFWAVTLLSIISAIFITQTVSPHLAILHYLRRIEVMILFFVALDAFKNISQIKKLMKVLFVVTVMVIIYGFGQQWFSFPVISTMNKEFSKGLVLFLTEGARVNSTFAGHYDLAIFLSIFLTIAIAFFFVVKDLKSRIIIILAGLLAFVLLALTAARVSFVSAILGIGGLLFLLKRKKLIVLMLLVSLLAFVISPDLRHRTVATITVNLLGGGGAKYTPPPQDPNSKKHFSLENATNRSASLAATPIDVAPGEPINSTELGVFRSFEIRLNVEWPRAVRGFLKNPFLGTGYSSLTIATDNDYLRSLGETGLLGFFSLSLIWFIIIKNIWLNFSKGDSFNKYFLMATLMSIVVIFVNATFIDVLESSKIAALLWLFLGVTFALIRINKSNG